MMRLSFIALLVSMNFAHAQISISSTDLPSVGDTILFSSADPFTTVVDLTQTGPNYTWDFSQLQWTMQAADTFIAVSNTGLYALFFSSFGSYPSNLVTKGADFNIFQFQITNVYNFYNKNASQYRQRGFGGSLNGIPIPVGFNNADVIYNFPIDFADQDTSNSDYSIQIPSLGSYFSNQIRTNAVDGWGTLITPYGSFNSLRVKSTIAGHDSLYIDSLSTGFGFDKIPTREYKWLGNGKGTPLLQIVTQEFFQGFEVVQSITYQDSSRITIDVNELQPKNFFSITPNPAVQYLTVGMNLRTPQAIQMEIYSSSGEKIYSELKNKYAGESFEQINISTLHLNEGIYIFKLTDGQSVFTKPIVVLAE